MTGYNVPFVVAVVVAMQHAVSLQPRSTNDTHDRTRWNHEGQAFGQAHVREVQDYQTPRRGAGDL